MPNSFDRNELNYKQLAMGQQLSRAQMRRRLKQGEWALYFYLIYLAYLLQIPLNGLIFCQTLWLLFVKSTKQNIFTHRRLRPLLFLISLLVHFDTFIMDGDVRFCGSPLGVQFDENGFKSILQYGDPVTNAFHGIRLSKTKPTLK